MTPLHPRSTLFPYTTLFRSFERFFAALSFGAGIAGGGQRSCQQPPARPIVINHKDWILRARHPLKQNRKVIVRDVYPRDDIARSEEHTSELQSRVDLVCRLL